MTSPAGGHDPTRGWGQEEKVFDISRVSSGRVGWSRVGSGRVRKVSNFHGWGPVTVTRPDPTRPVNSPGEHIRKIMGTVMGIIGYMRSMIALAICWVIQGIGDGPEVQRRGRDVRRAGSMAMLVRACFTFFLKGL